MNFLKTGDWNLSIAKTKKELGGWKGGKRGNEIKSRALNHSYYFLEENLKLPTKGKKLEKQNKQFV